MRPGRQACESDDTSPGTRTPGEGGGGVEGRGDARYQPGFCYFGRRDSALACSAVMILGVCNCCEFIFMQEEAHSMCLLST